MTNNSKWRVLYVEDDQQIANQVKVFFEEDDDVEPEKFEVTTVHDFDSAVHEIENRRFDILILDVINELNGEKDEEAGQRIFGQIKANCFIPVVFYTGVPNAVKGLKSSMVHIVSKDDAVPRLRDMVVDLIQTGIPSVNRALEEHIKHVKRDYMWDFVATHWEQYGKGGVSTSQELAYLLTRRLSVSLAANGVQQLAANLPSQDQNNLDDTEAALVEQNQPSTGLLSPMQYYMVPPVEKHTVYGDLYKNENEQFFVVLTPSCDFVQGNDDHILLAKCVLLVDHPEYKSWAKNIKKHKEKFERLLANRRRENLYFLPAFLQNPDLLIDLQQLTTVEKDDFQLYNRIASLDNAFAAELSSRFLRYYGRYGTPDLNVQQVYDRLLIKLKQQSNSVGINQ